MYGKGSSFLSGTGNTEAMAERVAQAASADLIRAADFTAARAADYDAIAFGCPAMGDEVLEECEFQPMYDSVKSVLSGKRVALFGSYGWGDGQWMRAWEEDILACGAQLVCGSIICPDAPDDNTLEELDALAAALG